MDLEEGEWVVNEVFAEWGKRAGEFAHVYGGGVGEEVGGAVNEPQEVGVGAVVGGGGWVGDLAEVAGGELVGCDVVCVGEERELAVELVVSVLGVGRDDEWG